MSFTAYTEGKGKDKKPAGKDPMPLSPLKSPSFLLLFRRGPVYRKIQQVLSSRKKAKPMVQSLDLAASNLMERVEAQIDFMLQGGDLPTLFQRLKEGITEPQSGASTQDIDFSKLPEDLPTQVASRLVYHGYDDNLVDIVVKGSQVIVYLDDRVKPDVKNIVSLLTKAGATEVASTPKENDLGTFVLTVEPASPGQTAPSPKVPDSQEESFTPSKKPKHNLIRILHQKAGLLGTKAEPRVKQEANPLIARLSALLIDDPSTIAPVLTSLLDPLETKPKRKKRKKRQEEAQNKPEAGDILVDTQTKQPFRVLAVLGNSLRVQGMAAKDEPTVISSLPIERGLISGQVRKINEEHEILEYAKTYCPNCLTKLERHGFSFKCAECSFVAEFQDTPTDGVAAPEPFSPERE